MVYDLSSNVFKYIFGISKYIQTSHCRMAEREVALQTHKQYKLLSFDLFL